MACEFVIVERCLLKDRELDIYLVVQLIVINIGLSIMDRQCKNIEITDISDRRIDKVERFTGLHDGIKSDAKRL